MIYFVFLLYSIGSRTDGPSQEKENKRWRLGTSWARQTSLSVVSLEVWFLRDSSFGFSPHAGNTLKVYVFPTLRWKTTWKFPHTVDQSEQSTTTRPSSQTSWEAVHRCKYPGPTNLTSWGKDQWSPRDYHTEAAYIDTSHIECSHFRTFLKKWSKIVLNL